MIDLKGKKVLVTGASGLLGRPLVDKLILRGADVHGIGIEPKPRDWPESAKYVSGDLGLWPMFTPLADFLDLYEPFEYIFHLAGAKGGVGIGRKRAADFLKANLESAMRFFDYLMIWPERRPKRILFTSSVGAYPGDKDIFVESDLENGPPHVSDYFGGYAKRFGEVLLKAYKEQHGLDYVVVRPTNCFGPYDRFDPETGMVVAALIAKFERGDDPVKIWGDGLAQRDFLYSEDCAKGMIRIMEKGQSGEAYNLGTGVAKPIFRIAQSLSMVYSNRAFEFDKTKPSGPEVRVMNMNKTFNLIDYGWSRTALMDALRETVEWYRENKDYQKYDPFRSKGQS